MSPHLHRENETRKEQPQKVTDHGRSQMPGGKSGMILVLQVLSAPSFRVMSIDKDADMNILSIKFPTCVGAHQRNYTKK